MEKTLGKRKRTVTQTVLDRKLRPHNKLSFFTGMFENPPALPSSYLRHLKILSFPPLACGLGRGNGQFLVWSLLPSLPSFTPMCLFLGSPTTHIHRHLACPCSYRNSRTSSLRAAVPLQKILGLANLLWRKGEMKGVHGGKPLGGGKEQVSDAPPSRSCLEYVQTRSVQPGEHSLMMKRTRRQGVPLSYPRGGETKLASKNSPLQVLYLPLLLQGRALVLVFGAPWQIMNQRRARRFFLAQSRRSGMHVWGSSYLRAESFF